VTATLECWSSEEVGNAILFFLCESCCLPVNNGVCDGVLRVYCVSMWIADCESGRTDIHCGGNVGPPCQGWL
jgi:hypothetical protein